MTTTHLSWGGARHFDIHVLRGETSRRLDEILQLNQEVGSPVSGASPILPGDVLSIQFLPKLRGLTHSGDLATGHGVKVNTKTGQVEALLPAPARAVANFLIEVFVLVRLANGTQQFLPVIRMRVHVHRTVLTAWLTPTPLSIHEGAADQRFGVLAEFDEGVPGQPVRTVGDVSEHPGITWTPGDASVDINDVGEMAGTAQAGTPLVQVTATLPDDLHSRTATGRVRVLARWDNQPADVRAAHLVPDSPGSRRPAGPARLAGAANVLFISEGFVDGERRLFERVVTELVRKLRTAPGTNPFKLLRKSVNYWWVFVPSPPRSDVSQPHHGLTTLYELDLVRRVGRLVGQEVPLPRPPRTGTTLSTINELVYEVGLPTPADVTDDENADLARKRGDWDELFGFDIDSVTPVKLRQKLFRQWRGLHDRRLANERDTALGLKLGERPAVEEQGEPHEVVVNPRRTSRRHLDQFLATLTDSTDKGTNGAGGPPIGSTWDSRPDPPGPDHNYLVALCAGARSGGATGRSLADPDRATLVATSLVDTEEVLLQAVAGAAEQLDLRPHPVPRTASGGVHITTQTLATAAHELAHALTIGDEYGTGGELPASRLAKVRAMRNLQATRDAEVETQNPDGSVQRTLAGEQVKWRWPLLLRAGRMTGKPDPQGGDAFIVALDPGHAGPFASGDLVHLRKPLPEGTTQGGMSDLLQVLDKAGDELLLLTVGGGTLAPDDFPAGSLVCEPALARPSAQQNSGDEHAELLDERIRTFINGVELPLNRVQPQCTPDGRKIQHPRHLPDDLPRGRPKFRAQIVGLYEGGAEFGCGVMHPTGMCIMRTYFVPGRPGTLTGFCLVCQYAIVDKLDPSRHAALAALFKNKDAQP